MPRSSPRREPVAGVLQACCEGDALVLLRCCSGIASGLVPCLSFVQPWYIPYLSLIHGFYSGEDFGRHTLSPPSPGWGWAAFVWPPFNGNRLLISAGAFPQPLLCCWQGFKEPVWDGWPANLERYTSDE